MSEIFENDIDLILLDTNSGIGDGDFDINSVVTWRVDEIQGENHLSFVGEFDGITEEVAYNLSQTKSITDNLIG